MRKFKINGTVYREVQAGVAEEIGYLHEEAKGAIKGANKFADLVQELAELDLPENLQVNLEGFANEYSDLVYELVKLNKQLDQVVNQHN